MNQHRMMTLEPTAIKYVTLLRSYRLGRVIIGTDADPPELPFGVVKPKHGASLAEEQPSVPIHTLDEQVRWPDIGSMAQPGSH